MRLFNREQFITNAPLKHGRIEITEYDKSGRPRRMETAGELACRLNTQPNTKWEKVRVITPAHMRTGEVLPGYGEVRGTKRRKIGPFKF